MSFERSDLDEERSRVYPTRPDKTFTATRETVDNKGRRNGAYGPGFAQVDVRAGYRLRFGPSRTVDLFAEVFDLTNRANFNDPSGDRRSGNFLVPTQLRGGGFPRQMQLGIRIGY